MKRLALTALIALALALTLAGCGSSKSSTSGTAAAAFTAKADAICSSSSKAIAQVPASAGVLAIRSDAALMTSALTKLHELSPPPDRATAFDSLLSSLKAQASRWRQIAVAAEAKDSREVSTLNAQDNRNENTAKSLATAAGIEVCG